MWKLKYKVPVGFTYTIQRHIDSIEIKVKKPEENVWREAIVERELLESWGGYGRDCGGASYKVRIKHPDIVLSVAEGLWSYQACIPSVPNVKNYAITELKFEMPCDIRIIYDDVEVTFLVRYLNEFEVT
jgi:hypothetical protein